MASNLYYWHELCYMILLHFLLQYKLGTPFTYCIYLGALPRSVSQCSIGIQFTFTLLNDWHRKFTGISSQYISLASIPCWFMKWSAPFFRSSFLVFPLTTKSQSRPVSRQAKTNIGSTTSSKTMYFLNLLCSSIYGPLKLSIKWKR